MRELIENGYVYIAQPPLFRAKRGRSEQFIRDERALETWLIKRAVAGRTVELADGTQFSGEQLEARLEKLIAFRKFLQIVERRGMPRDVILAALDRGAREKAFFEDGARVEELAAAITSPVRTATVKRDEEHQAFAIAIEDRSVGYPRHHVIDQDFVSTGEFRTLASSYQDVSDFRGEMTVRTIGAEDVEDQTAEDAGTATANETAIGGAPLDEATKLAAEPKTPDASALRAGARGKDGDVRVESLDELVEFFTAAGKKGVAINRYKGLGEMNPDTLWDTTMNPETRTLAQVKAEDHMEADLMFTTRMGDQVEPRRKFIEDNALDVKNLDI
jgi:DNA gyrase subunit B